MTETMRLRLPPTSPRETELAGDDYSALVDDIELLRLYGPQAVFLLGRQPKTTPCSVSDGDDKADAGANIINFPTSSGLYIGLRQVA